VCRTAATISASKQLISMRFVLAAVGILSSFGSIMSCVGQLLVKSFSNATEHTTATEARTVGTTDRQADRAVRLLSHYATSSSNGAVEQFY